MYCTIQKLFSLFINKSNENNFSGDLFKNSIKKNEDTIYYLLFSFVFRFGGSFRSE